VPTALITGILGQDGSLLADLLTERGYRVVGIARRGDPKREVIELDLSTLTQEAASELLARVQPDEVYHLAAAHRSSEPGLQDDPDQQRRMTMVNHDVALMFANAVGSARLIVAASSQMYAPSLPAARIDEATPHAPATFYGTTKSKALHSLATLRERGLAVSTAILFNHESPRRSVSFVSRKITQAAARIAAGLERALVLGDLSSRADFFSARDAVEGLHAMALAEPGEFVLASGELHGMADLCEVAFAAVGLDWREYVRSTREPGERAALVGDPRKAERVLGWKRTRDFTTWVTEMVEADRKQP
jgi:GDPmannose 4,6-dehydratase